MFLMLEFCCCCFLVAARSLSVYEDDIPVSVALQLLLPTFTVFMRCCDEVSGIDETLYWVNTRLVEEFS